MNTKAAKDLIWLYRSIANGVYSDLSLKDLKDLIGFGSPFTCRLCLDAKKEDIDHYCMFCIYYEDGKQRYSCLHGTSEETYKGIEEADNLDEMKTAVKKRADYIQSLLDNMKNTH